MTFDTFDALVAEALTPYVQSDEEEDGWEEDGWEEDDDEE